MRRLVKKILNATCRPVLVKYLSTARTYSHKGIRLKVYPGVFHPGFFFSTRLLLRHIGSLPLEGRSFLELGAGSGLISLYAARRGARVTATDINPGAISCLHTNRTLNNIGIEIVHSDLFKNLTPGPFDIIAVNPPFYRRQPATDAERAWYCGENGEYFTGFFSGLRPYTCAGSEIWMILSDGSPLVMVADIAKRYGWQMHCIVSKGNWVEQNFIFRIEPLASVDD